MTKNWEHIKNQPELNSEIQEIISGSNIAWNKTKEDMWPEMLEKIEGKGHSITKTNRIIYLQLKQLAVAAVFLILLGIPAVMYFYTKTIETTIKQTAEIFLPDNSQVTINAQSVLSYKPMIWMFNRSVKFNGEAFFKVQKGKKFEVISKKGKTIVLGTQFNIYSRDNNYNVTCFSGKVKVIESTHQNNVIITGNQKAVLKSDGNFEIQDLNTTQPKTSNKSHNNTVEEELNKILSTPAVQEQHVKKERDKVYTNIKVVEKKQADLEEHNNAEKQNATKVDNKAQNQSLKEIQNKEQSKTEPENKEQEQNQNKAKDQNIGNQQNNDKFSASLTPEQISILENKQMNKEEKRKAFMESLSEKQRLLLKEQNEERAKQAESNKNIINEKDNIKEQQKIQTKEQLRENTGKENIKSGGEGGTSSGEKPETPTGKGN